MPAVKEELPLAPAEAFSIDDSATTEIDDALSVQGLGSGRVTVGIHIAAPALAVAPQSAVDRIARDRLSTVYIPGHKLTMLPDAVVEAFTLAEGREAPVLSLYVTVDETTLATLASETRIERIRIAANLRHDKLESEVNEATLAAGLPASVPFAAELTFLHGLARHLKAGREAVRGKPEIFNRPDYAFRVDTRDGAAIVGDERVEIVPRQRGSPLDLIVAESMILANSTWGGWIAACGVPAIYRSQQSLAPGVKVRMGLRPGPHAGMGVAQYAWATSPLRRYVDLVNQWQLIACARHGKTAALAAPFRANDVNLHAIVSDFDAAYAEYNGFQGAIERYWALRSLQQDDIGELDATVMKDGLVRADDPAAGVSCRRRRTPAARRARPGAARRRRPADARPPRQRHRPPRHDRGPGRRCRCGRGRRARRRTADDRGRRRRGRAGQRLAAGGRVGGGLTRKWRCASRRCRSRWPCRSPCTASCCWCASSIPRASTASSRTRRSR